MTEDRALSRVLLDHLRQPETVAALWAHMGRQRWFGGRDRTLDQVRVVDAVAVFESGEFALWSVLMELGDAGGSGDLYHLLLSSRPASDAITDDRSDIRFVMADMRAGSVEYVVDALHDGAALATLWEAMSTQRTIPGAAGALRCHNLRMAHATSAGAGDAGPDVEGAAEGQIHHLGRDQSNSSAVRADRELLKVMRHVAHGTSPELEMTDALARAGFASTPAPLGAVDYVPESGEAVLLATLQPFLHNGTEGWTLAMTSLRALYAEVEESLVPNRGPGVRDEDIGMASTFAAEAGRLGRLTAEMHLALLNAGNQEALLARPATAADWEGWSRDMVTELDALLARDEEALGRLRAHRSDLVGAFDAVRRLTHGGIALRIHGDYHLGQTLRTDGGWIVIDFEGEPNRPLAERRKLSTALRDVAGMLRSFDYAAAAALAERIDITNSQRAALQPVGDAWAEANREAFWSTYVATTAGSGLLPEGTGIDVLLRAYELRKAVYEIGYELGHRPSWVSIPLRFLLRIGLVPVT